MKNLNSHLKKLEETIAAILERLSSSLEVELHGLENIPKSGPVLICANHSGYVGLDAVILTYHLTKKLKRRPRVITHKAWFVSSLTKQLFEHFGFIKATRKNIINALKNEHVVLLFPEGEDGNFKSSVQMYRLRRFRTGFLSAHFATRAPIVPCLILGAEETHLSLTHIQLPKWALGGLKVPIPLNILPRKEKWDIHFLKPIVRLPFDLSEVESEEREDLLNDLAGDIRNSMQRRLTAMLRHQRMKRNSNLS